MRSPLNSTKNFPNNHMVIIALGKSENIFRCSRVIKNHLENNQDISEILSVSGWIGPKRINGIKISKSFKFNLRHKIKNLGNLTLHPRGGSSYKELDMLMIDPQQILRLKNISSKKITIFSDSQKVMDVINQLLVQIKNDDSVEIYNELINEYDTIDSSGANQKVERKLSHKTSILIIQPDWTRCGSAKTFDLVGRLSNASGLFPIRIQSSVESSETTMTIGKTYANSPSESFPAVGIKIGLKRLTRLITLSRIFIFHILSGNRHSVVKYKYSIHAAVKMRKSQIKFIEKIAPEVIYTNHYFNLPLAIKIKKSLTRIGLAPKIILDTHDLQYRNYLEQNYRVPLNWYPPVEEVERTLEYEYLSSPDALVFVSEKERQEYLSSSAKYNLKAQEVYFAIPIDTKLPKMASSVRNEQSQKINILLVMADNEANRQSLSWFIESVYPRIEHMNIEVKIVGDINKSNKGATFPLNLTFLGRVENIHDYYVQSHIAVLPILSGNGIAIKTLEALEYGKPYIGTSVAGRGISSIMEEGFHDTQEGFISDLLNLIQSQDLRDERAQIALNLFQELQGNSYESKFSRIVHPVKSESSF
jgi:hypothetical protein